MTFFYLNGEAASGGEMISTFMQFGFLALIFVAFYFFLIRPQRKRDKESQRMRESVEVGDEIITNAGIIGIIVSIKDDTVVIETGSDRSKIRIKKWAIQSNETIHEAD